MVQDRWVSYIYRYENNVRCENAGFIKGCLALDKVKIRIGLNLYKDKTCRCRIFFLYKTKDEDKEENSRAKYFADMDYASNGRDMFVNQIAVPFEDTLLDGRPFYEYDGLLFLFDTGEVFIGLWKEYKISVDDILIDVEENDIGENVEVSEAADTVEIAEVSEAADTVEIAEARECADIDETADVSENICTEELTDDALSLAEQIISTYPKLPIFFDSPFESCVKIIPQDIGKLDMRNWKLASNSFLVHGYYNYRYLMLGEMKNDKSVVLGVPGVFNNKEKYMANMFGFKTFIPVKKTDVLTGSFGYWVVSVFSE